jgi:hypothetical protein
VGADPAAGMKYAKIIGQKEKAVESVSSTSLASTGPAVILGNSNTPGVLGYVMSQRSFSKKLRGRINDD